MNNGLNMLQGLDQHFGSNLQPFCPEDANSFLFFALPVCLTLTLKAGGIGSRRFFMGVPYVKKDKPARSFRLSGVCRQVVEYCEPLSQIVS